LVQRGEYDEAVTFGERSLRILAKLQDHIGVASVWHLLGRRADLVGDQAGARQKYEGALGKFQDVGDLAGQAKCWQALAWLDIKRVDRDSAHEKFRWALTAFEEIGDQVGEAATRHGLAAIYIDEGNVEAALEE